MGEMAELYLLGEDESIYDEGYGGFGSCGRYLPTIEDLNVSSLYYKKSPCSSSYCYRNCYGVRKRYRQTEVEYHNFKSPIKIKRETNKAYLCIFESGEIWLPKSRVRTSNGELVSIEEWLYKEKESEMQQEEQKPKLGEIISVKTYMTSMPKNCEECDYFQSEYDEDALWGSGETLRCVFGASNYGCRIERPKDCPLYCTK